MLCALHYGTVSDWSPQGPRARLKEKYSSPGLGYQGLKSKNSILRDQEGWKSNVHYDHPGGGSFQSGKDAYKANLLDSHRFVNDSLHHLGKRFQRGAVLMNVESQ